MVCYSWSEKSRLWRRGWKWYKHFETKNFKSILCEYSHAYILVTGDITATGGNENANVAFKNFAPFTKCITHINDEHIDIAESLDITMPM